MKKTAAQIRAEDDPGKEFFSRFGVHFCLVSKQAAPNFLPVVLYRPACVVLFVSSEMKAEAESLAKAIARAAPGTRIETIGVENAWDIEKCRDLVADALARHEDEKPIVNVTGGTKIMAFAALTTAFELEMPSFYLNENDNTISVLSPRRMGEADRIPPIAISVSIKNYLAAYGYEVLESSPAPTLSLDVREKLDSIIRASSMQEAVPVLNFLAGEAAKAAKKIGGRSIPPVDFSAARDLLGAKRKGAFDVLCDQFAGMKRLRLQKNEILFPSEEDRFFVAGGWLEAYTASIIQSLGHKALSNLVVERAETKNEIDAAFMDKGTFYIIECKTCGMSDADDVLYKLESLGKLSGLKTRLILVSYQPLNKAAMKRAANSRITVIQTDQLKDLAGCIRGVISK